MQYKYNSGSIVIDNEEISEDYYEAIVRKNGLILETRRYRGSVSDMMEELYKRACRIPMKKQDYDAVLLEIYYTDQSPLKQNRSHWPRPPWCEQNPYDRAHPRYRYYPRKVIPGGQTPG